MNIRNRVKELRLVFADDLAPNPKNWRTHPAEQRKAMTALLEEIGFAAAALARELPDGTLMLIDGHMRQELAAGSRIPVLVLDVTEDEADRLLMTLDPMKDMADADAAALESLLETIETESKAVERLLELTAEKAGLSPDEDEAYEPEEAAGLDEPPAGVRMVQLFLSESNIAIFQRVCETLADRYGTDNITDTVLESLRRASSSL